MKDSGEEGLLIRYVASASPPRRIKAHEMQDSELVPGVYALEWALHTGQWHHGNTRWDGGIGKPFHPMRFSGY